VTSDLQQGAGHSSKHHTYRVCDCRVTAPYTVDVGMVYHTSLYTAKRYEAMMNFY